MQKKKPNLSSHQFNHKKLNSPDDSKSSKSKSSPDKEEEEA